MSHDVSGIKEVILEIQVNAALAGHDIGPFEPVDTVSDGYCQRWLSGSMQALSGCRSASNIAAVR